MDNHPPPIIGDTMKSKREYLHGLGLTKAPTGKGRFSAAAHEAIEKAYAKGVKFTDDIPVEKPVKKSVEKSVGKTVKVSAVKADTSKADPAAVRKWAGENGITVGARGRIHADVWNAYYADVPADEVAERTNEYDPFRDTAPRSYPEGTTFQGVYSHGGKDHTVTVSDRAACCNCRTSLVICRCNRPSVVNSHGTGAMSVTPIYPKG